MREDQVAFVVELQVEIEELRRTLQDQDVSDPSVIVIVEQKLTATRGIWAACAGQRRNLPSSIRNTPNRTKNHWVSGVATTRTQTAANDNSPIAPLAATGTAATRSSF